MGLEVSRLPARNACIVTALAVSLFCPSLRAAQLLPLTLDQALRLAEQNSITLRKAEAEVGAAEGGLREVGRPLFNNPELSTEVARRRAPGETGRDWAIGLSQELEIARQQRFRREAAALNLSASEQFALAERLRVRNRTNVLFIAVLFGQERVRTEEEALAVVGKSAEIVRKRVAAGEDTRLDANLAEVEVGRLLNLLEAARQQLLDARTELAAFLQLQPQTLPEAVGTLDPQPLQAVLDALLARAAQQPALQALDLREREEQRLLDLQRATRYPNPSIGLVTSREGAGTASERITGLTFSVPLPLFRRNEAAIARAYANAAQARIDRIAAARDTQARIRSLWSRLEVSRQRLDTFRDKVLPLLTQNLDLSERSYRAGEIGLSELLIVNRQVLDARRDALAAAADYASTRAELELVAGLDPIGERGP